VSNTENNSYGRILKTGTLLGGSSVINIGLKVVRTKVVALRLGPSLFGVMSLYTTLTTMISSISSLGIRQSAVREVAVAAGSGDDVQIARTVLSLRRVVWITGLTGMAATVGLALPASYWTFGDYNHAWVIALLSVTVFLTQIESGQLALLQGLRRIRDVTSVQVIGAIWSTVLGIPILLYWRERGIAPFLIVVAVGQVGTSWWYARQVHTLRVKVSWSETWEHSRHMISLGLAFVVAGIGTSLSVYLIRLIIQRNAGEVGVGLYQAAYAMSTVYVGFVLQAMAGDYYPRLAGVCGDLARRNQLVNEQAEAAVLLAVPGLVGAMVFSEPLLWLLYSSSFEAASTVLRWHVLGLLGRIVSWPIGFVLLARGDKIAFAGSEIAAAAAHVGLVYLGVKWYGVAGAGAAFAGMYAFYVIWIRWIVRRRHGYRWGDSTKGLLLMGLFFVAVGFATTFIPGFALRLFCGAFVLTVATAICFRGMYTRLGPERIARLRRGVTRRLPFVKAHER